ncbi:hypothetical protein AB6A40_004610 [Gnathostoma spinigerum]|uniref:Sidoreflexin n=1 Tax=Gnathostoma spinigerum TaxID=75299 RepID=A0ABD6EE27_9BILA
MSQKLSELPCEKRPDIFRPKWDQSSYLGRLKHFLTITNPLNLLADDEKLRETEQIVLNYRKGIFNPSMTVDELWKVKHIYDSAFHPDTGERMVSFGRMSAQVPCNTVLITAMQVCYKSTIGTIVSQWLNQTFNAVVNFTNRSGNTVTTNQQLLLAYFGATGGAVGTALGLNSVAKRFPPLINRLVPFAAVAAANFINIFMMRYREIEDGTDITNDKGEKVGASTVVAFCALTEVLISRIGMSSLPMVLTPICVNALMKKPWYRSRRWLDVATQSLLAATLLLISTPGFCALFPQRMKIPVNRLEKSVQEDLRKKSYSEGVVYYNKGL